MQDAMQKSQTDSRPKKVAILGSTGSIGTQALEVIKQHSQQLEVEVITANNNCDLLIKQAIEFQPNSVVIANKEKYPQLKKALGRYPIDVYSGSEALAQIVEMDSIDVVLTAMVGFSGLLPTINAIKKGKNIALANKETLVVAGELIKNLAAEQNVHIYPVDSEHSAIFQCLVGEENNPIEKIYLTASGGPFRGKSIEFLKTVTKHQALKHPNWEMGAKITIDSASLMNKGLEAIEAKWLFDLTPEQIDVIVHPQSIIHSIVQFTDSSMKSQMGLPDMRVPIQYALSYPKRYVSDFPRFNFMDYPELTFEAPDSKKFKNLALCMEAMKQGGNIPCILNAANEIVVEAFLKERIAFLRMPEIIEETISRTDFIEAPDYDLYLTSDAEARNVATSLL